MAVPGAAFAASVSDAGTDRQEFAYRRPELDDEGFVSVDEDEDEDEVTDDVTDDAETVVKATATSNGDGDSTRGDDGTNGALTVTSNGDDDDTRGDDGTSDGDLTRGEDGTGDGDDTATTDDPETATGDE